ncbi:hypothetical protein C5F61_09990 [Photobacterium damselae subsp. damselae]|uniref:hypothetical protein n=1 Tax=Photobacterium damselae TaxID=38293 RepID=UPI000D04E8C5|nr:hypothetical protein [Photobacterium damselae]PSB77822.1 hypothetical protein C5F61_09990 [Photobacterium damselae subsp. damselae]
MEKNFNRIITDVLAEMLQGKTFNKCQLNTLIPLNMNKSANDIIRTLHKRGEVKISHRPPKKHMQAHWYIAPNECKQYLFSPTKSKMLNEKSKVEASYKRDISCVRGIINRRGEEAFIQIINKVKVMK